LSGECILILNFPFRLSMMANITYLLGAGASANTIPVVADMHKRIEEVIDFKNHVYLLL